MKRIFAAMLVLFGLATGAMACPNYSFVGDEYSATGDELWSRADFSVVAGGSYSVLDCGIRALTDRGEGYFTEAPDFSVYLSGMGPYALHISVLSNCDSTLLINTGAANWYYDDDDNGDGDPLITLSNPSNGRIDIWVGTYDGIPCDAVMSLETF